MSLSRRKETLSPLLPLFIVFELLPRWRQKLNSRKERKGKKVFLSAPQVTSHKFQESFFSRPNPLLHFCVCFCQKATLVLTPPPPPTSLSLFMQILWGSISSFLLATLHLAEVCKCLRFLKKTFLDMPIKKTIVQYLKNVGVFVFSCDLFQLLATPSCHNLMLLGKST